VLGPEEREHGELEVVRRTFEQLADTVELPVRETESLVEGLVGDSSQGCMVSGVPDGPSNRPTDRLDSGSAETARPIPSFKSHISSS
jgi:hypothetical protein